METINPVYARLLVRELERADIDIEPLLKGAGLSRDALFRGGDLAMQEFLHVLQGAEELGGSMPVGLMLGRNTNVLALGALGVAMSVAPTIRQGLQAAESYTRLHASYVRVGARSLPHCLRLEMGYASDPGRLRRFHTETGFMALQNYVEVVWGSALQGAVFCFDFKAPSYVDDYAECFHGECRFGEPHPHVDLPREYLDQPSPFYNAELWHDTMASLSQRLNTLSGGGSEPYTQFVAGLLRSSEPPLPDLSQVAAGLFISERTLNRRLQGEGGSFRELKTAALMDWARLFLDHTELSIDNVAGRLGYQDTANFRRAFRKSVGCTPNSYRRRLQSAGENQAASLATN